MRYLQGAICVVVLFASPSWRAEEPGRNNRAGSEKPQAERRSIQRALEPFNDWIGTWRGVGQPRRGSNKGAWIEEATWEWRIDQKSVGIRVEVKSGKLWQVGILGFELSNDCYTLTLVEPGEEGGRVLSGRLTEKGRLELEGAGGSSETRERWTFRMLHEDRLLVLVESRPMREGSVFARVAEIGYTRKGGSFAAAADSGPKCIVTDGRGSMAVEYKGKTYYVCCSGCRQAFLDDPEGVIEDAKRRAAEKATSNQEQG